MPGLGSNQILKLSGTAEATYGATIGEPAFAVIGLVEDGDVGGKTNINKIFGIGAQGYQAAFAGIVENSLRATLVSPTAAEMNKAITRTAAGALRSYNFVAGQGGEAWKGVGLKWDSMDLEIDSDNPLKCSLSGMFKSIIDDDDAASGHDPTPITLWRPQGLVLTIGGIEDADVVSCRISVKNNLSTQGVANAALAGNKRVIKYLKEGSLEVDATIQTYTAPPFELEDDDLGCEASNASLVLTFTDLCGGGTPDTLTITCSNGTMIETRQPLKANEYTDYTLGYTFEGISIA